jgi:hypothetical protein
MHRIGTSRRLVASMRISYHETSRSARGRYLLYNHWNDTISNPTTILSSQPNLCSSSLTFFSSASICSFCLWIVFLNPSLAVSPALISLSCRCRCAESCSKFERDGVSAWCNGEASCTGERKGF